MNQENQHNSEIIKDEVQSVEQTQESLTIPETVQKSNKPFKMIYLVFPIVALLASALILLINFVNSQKIPSNDGVKTVNQTESKENTIPENKNNEVIIDPGDGEEKPQEVSKKIPLNTFFYVVGDFNSTKYKNNLKYVDLTGKQTSLNYNVIETTPSYGNRYVLFLQHLSNPYSNRLAVLDKNTSEITFVNIKTPKNSVLTTGLHKNSISPDGKKAFILANFSKSDLTTSDYYEYIGYGMYIYDFETKKITTITNSVTNGSNMCSVWYVQWSGDSKTVYLNIGNEGCITEKEVNEETTKVGLNGIYEYNLNTNKFTKIFTTSYELDGIYVKEQDKFVILRAYASSTDLNENDMTELTVEKGEVKKILDTKPYGQLQSVSDISPDSKKIVYMNDYQTYRIVDFDGKEVAVISGEGDNSGISYANWISNTQLVVENLIDKEQKGIFTDLYLFDITTKKMQRLTTTQDVSLQSM